MKKNLSFCFIFLAGLFCQSSAMAAHGISIDGQLKYGPDFTHFDYASPLAVKGGDLVLHDLGSFDKMNPYTLKGTAAAGLTDFVFETLAVASLDEPFAEYGLIAKNIEVAKDRLSITYTIDERARFSDGTPITPEDVKFSLEILKSSVAHPFYSTYLQDISTAEIIDPGRVRFRFKQTNREIHMIASQLPIFSKKFYENHPFDESTLTPPLGSGPYIVDTVNAGKSISYRRNPDYWAKDHPCRKGIFNFDTITFKYFKDQIISVEAFKAHNFDFMYINIAKQWARDLTGPKFDDGRIKKEYLDHMNNAGMQGFAFNTRRSFFKDQRVRKALGLAFDFEQTNKTLFFDQYTQAGSYFSNSELAAIDLPQGLELSYLEPFRDQLPAEVFTTPLTPVSGGSRQQVRKNLRQARELLQEAGWTIRDGILLDKEGSPFQFEILLVSPSFERVMASYVKNLKILGIQASYRTIDPALYIRQLRNFDFDMTVKVFGQSQSPGNEQRDYWSSAAAEQLGSQNLCGIKNSVVDKLVDRIIYAASQEELTAACRALDRVLWYGYYVVPNWYVARHRVVYWNIFERPKVQPLYYSPMQALMTWWEKQKSEGRSQETE